MARLVNCRLLKKELPGLEFPPFPGPDGQSIYDSISKEAWSKWVAHQTTLINEKRLNMMDENARKYLSDQRNRFFNGEDVDQAEGFVAPNE